MKYFSENWTTISLRLAVIASLMSLHGCGYLFGDDGVFRDKSKEYRDAKETQRMKLPEGVSDESIVDLYVIPPIKEEVLIAEDFDVPTPTPLSAAATRDTVRIQRLGDESWALVALAPGQLWPEVRNFVNASGLQVERADPNLGLIDTGFAVLEGETMASRFRFRIDQGVQRGNSELHILQMNQAGDVTRWPQTSDNTDLEYEVLRSTAQYIANSSEGAAVSMVADRAMNAGGRILIKEDEDGRNYLLLQLAYVRAWASVERALGLSGFEVTDKDRSDGKYYVTFVGAEKVEESSWFSGIFGADEASYQNKTFIVDINGDETEGYRIYLNPQDDGIPISKKEVQVLLVVIKGNVD